jgi:hypothetical protein
MTTPSLRLCDVAALLLACWTAGCTQSDGVLGRMANHDEIREDGSAPQACARTSPEVTLQGHGTCTGRLAASRFSSALCVCNNVQSTGGLITRGFASGQGPYQEGLAANSGAPVGVNGTCTSLIGASDIGGSFSVAGSQAQQFVGSLMVWGDLRIGGNLQVMGPTTVARDAWLAGDFAGLGPLVVTSALHHASPNVSALVLLAGSNQQESVTVQPPCACGASDILDIAGLVNAAKTDNDNKSFGVRTDVLASLTGPKEWTLPCGRIYLSQITGPGDLLIHVSGSSALFIDGSINLQGKLTFLPTAGAELDVFVKDNLAVPGPIALADNTRPAAGRISVGGSQAITLSSPFVGNLYAPKAPVKTAGSAIEVWGSLFVYDFQGGASLSVVFDRDIAKVGTDCTAPLPPTGLCTQCGWCYDGTACIRGVCTACTKDSDCCGQAVCSDGQCAPLVMVIK